MCWQHYGTICAIAVRAIDQSMRASFVRILTVVCKHRTARLLLAKEPFLSRGVSEKQEKGRGESLRRLTGSSLKVVPVCSRASAACLRPGC